MDKNTILNYVTETPGNTNRAVLSSMLDSIEDNSSAEEGVLLYEGDHEISSTETTIYFDFTIDTERSICLPAGYDKSLYKIYFGDDVQYCYVQGIKSSSLDGTEMKIYNTRYPYVVKIFSTNDTPPCHLSKMYLNIMGPSTQMHIKIYQVA